MHQRQYRLHEDVDTKSLSQELVFKLLQIIKF